LYFQYYVELGNFYIKGEDFAGFFEKQRVLERQQENVSDTDHKHALNCENVWM